MNNLNGLQAKYKKAQDFSAEYSKAHSFLGKVKQVWVKIKSYANLFWLKFKSAIQCFIKSRLSSLYGTDIQATFSTFFDNFADASVSVADVISTAIPGLNFIVMAVRIFLILKPLYDSVKMIKSIFDEGLTEKEKYTRAGKGVAGIVMSLLYILSGLKFSINLSSTELPEIVTEEEAFLSPELPL